MYPEKILQMIAKFAKARTGNPTEALQYLMSLGTKPRLRNGTKLPTEAGLSLLCRCSTGKL